MYPVFIKVFLIFTVLKVISIGLHFLGSSPYGGPLVDNPSRFLANSILIELSLILGFTLLASKLAQYTPKWKKAVLTWSVLFLSLYQTFCHFDLEIVRWMGQHVTISYINTYLHKTDGIMLTKLLASDIFPLSITVFQIVILVPLSIWVIRSKKFHFFKPKPSKLNLLICLILLGILGTSRYWLMFSDKRWRRIKPVAIGLVQDLSVNVLGTEKPKNPNLAYADLLSFVKTGQLATEPLEDIPQYPLEQPKPMGTYSISEFKNRPKTDKPNIIFIVFETWNGWKSGFIKDSSVQSYTPNLDSILTQSGYVFPWSHSVGFPSVEGSIGMHLGSWPHFRKIFISEYIAINSLSLPEAFRLLGYHSEIFIGADPSFSNLTPWFQRWYDYFEYSPEMENDGPLISRFISALDTISREKPFFMATWTVTTHPPYYLPDSEGIPRAKTQEGRYNQAIQYADKHLGRLFKYLRNSDIWDNSIVVITGDHAQPGNKIRNDASIAGSFTPSHTWTPIAITGGWKGVPKPKINTETVSQIDIAVTLLDMVNAYVPNHFMGNSLLHPVSRPTLTFRWGDFARTTDVDRILMNIHSNELLYYSLDKTNKTNYGLRPGHSMIKSESTPFPLDLNRYRDMLFAYGELLNENRLYSKDLRKQGTYHRP